MKAILFSVLISIFGSSCLFAAETTAPVSKETLVKMAKEYHLSQVIKKTSLQNFSRFAKDLRPSGRDRRCEDYEQPGPSGKCVDAVCEKLGSYGCDSQSELADVAMICSSQYNESCINSTCSRLGSYGCDSLSELKDVANLCENVRSSGCIDQVCERLGSYGCDSLSEIDGVTKVCSGIRDTGCIENMCKRLGSYGCDSLSEIDAVAKTCKGQ